MSMKMYYKPAFPDLSLQNLFKKRNSQTLNNVLSFWEMLVKESKPQSMKISFNCKESWQDTKFILVMVKFILASSCNEN